MRIIIIIGILFCFQVVNSQPLSEITTKENFENKRVLPYADLNERDILFEKKVYRIIDSREKRNLPFRYPEATLIEILKNGIEKEFLTAYEPGEKIFSQEMSSESINKNFYQIDTVRVVNPDGTDEWVVVENQMNYEDIIRYRLYEIWYFETQSSQMKVRIMGIAPLISETDEYGNFLYERPLFWIHLPSSRDFLADHLVMNPTNQADQISWEQYLERRQFSSYIYKEANLHDRRLQDYLSGTDLLSESYKIEEEIFNWERDLWSK
ncbi:MAG: gliding motility protein GldN [Saprospiraceae bacterium]